MSPNPIKDPNNLIIMTEKIVTTKPIKPLEIFFFEDSKELLSPPEVIIPIAPVIKVNTNQIIATRVNIPIVKEITVAKMLGASVGALPSSPSGPNPE